MTREIRTFVGIPVEPTDSIRWILDELSHIGGVKLVAGDTMHITLKFLGDTLHDQVDHLSQLIKRATEGQQAIDIRLTGLDAFPNRERPSIVWAALTGAEPIITMANTLMDLLEPEGFAREERGFTPHLTLARVRAERRGSRMRIPEAVLELLREHQDTDFGTARLDKVVFYKSVLSDSGPTYTPLTTVSLDPPRS